CDRFRSTSAARRSANVCTATAIGRHGNENGGGRLAPPSRGAESPRSALALEGGLELRAGGELRHRRRRDLDALPRARIDPLTRRALRRRELPEPGEVHGVAALQRLRDGLHEGIDRLAGVTSREPALLGDLLDEVLLRQRTFLLRRGLEKRPSDQANSGAGYRSTMRICGGLGGLEELRGPKERPQP